MFFFLKQKVRDLCTILNLQKTNYVISKHWMDHKVVSVLDERGEVGEGGEWRMSHCSSMAGEGELQWAGDEATGGGCQYRNLRWNWWPAFFFWNLTFQKWLAVKNDEEDAVWLG
jgi:hypothetical protein